MNYKEYIKDVKSDRRSQAIMIAIQLFFEKGIADVAMTDIAKESEIGVASLYRYFNTKKNLVIESATYIWDDLSPLFEDLLNSSEYKNAKGCEQIYRLGMIFVNLYNEFSVFLRFIHDFDSFVILKHITPKELEEYEKSIFNFYEYFSKAVVKGISDNTIRSDFDSKAFYITTTQTLMAFSQKLCSPRILKSDSDITGEIEIKTLVDIFVNYIKI